jgi:hypothetical protein
VGGQSWDRDQEKVEVDAVAGGRGPTREFRITLAAKCSMERKFFHQLNLLFEDCLLWLILPMPDCSSASFRSLAFSLLSRIGCLVERYIHWRHKRFPVRGWLLLALRTRQIAQELYELWRKFPCLFDPWWANFMGVYGNVVELLLSMDALMTLKHLAYFIHVDNELIEVIWAHLRRVQQLSSVQTWAMEHENLSATYTVAQARRRRDSPIRVLLDKIEKDEEVKRKRMLTDEPKSLRGKWSSFMSERLRASGGRMEKGMGGDYQKDLEDPEKDESLGSSAATARSLAQLGSARPFGPLARDLVRRRAELEKDAALRRAAALNHNDDDLTELGNAGSSSSCVGVAAGGLPGGFAAPDFATQLKLKSLAEKNRKKESALALDEFRNGPGALELAQVCSKLESALAPQGSHCDDVPSRT